MSDEANGSTEVLRAVWQGTPGAMQELDEECNPNKVCRNMKDVSFEGFGGEGVDVATAWRNKLDREGKRSGQSLGDLLSNG
jgi:hypothetical protein